MNFLKKNADYATFVLRLGLAITLLWSVRTKFTDPSRVSNLFSNAGLPASEGFVTVVGVVLLLLSLMLIFGWKVRVVGILLSIFFLVTLLAAFSAGPAVWKDFALLGASISLALSGAGGALAVSNE